MFAFGRLFGDDDGGGPRGAGGGTQRFEATYRCFSVSFLVGTDRSDVEKGGKIMMPPSALDQLTRLNIQYPMLFKLENSQKEKQTHCGVLEFVADEGRIYLPYWMMKNLLLDEGDLVHLTSTSLPVASFSKFQPQSPDFLDISNPKAVLEQALRSFACLTQGDVIAITYNNKVYEICVLETLPAQAVSIIECDMKVDFAAPVGYQEPKKATPIEDEPDQAPPSVPEESSFRAFNCRGNRLDGKSKNTESAPVAGPSTASQPPRRGVPNYNYERNKINFIRKPLSSKISESEIEGDDEFKAFEGTGFQLRSKKR